MQEPIVSIIILNYNGLTTLKEKMFIYLNSVLKTDYPTFEVLFVDNGSTDDSVNQIIEKFGSQLKLTVIKLNKNYGYADGNNKGFQKINKVAKYIVILNNDIKVEDDWLKPLVYSMENDLSIGVIGGKILKILDNSIDSAGGYIDSFGFSYIRKCEVNELNKKQDVFFVFGSAFMIRRDAFEKVGGFDDTFFLQNEEIDLCWRMRLMGYKIVYIPESIFYHDSGSSTSKMPSSFLSFHSSKNRLTTLIKNYQINNLIKYSVLLILIYIFYALIQIFKGNISIGLSYFKAIFWNIFNFPKNWNKRKYIQSKRIINDFEIKRRGLIIEPKLMNKFYGKHEL